MLNVGKLGSGAAEYYVGEVASSAEDYYSGRGEAAGRWVGSLATELGLAGEVDPEHFRWVLQGRDPHTGEYLVSAQGSAGRAAKRRSERTVEQGSLDEVVDVLRAAAQLGVSGQYVRRLLAEGAAFEARCGAAAAAGEARPQEPSAFLVGTRHPSRGWLVARQELERFSAGRRVVKDRPGFDLTLRPPKSVSVLWALADDERRRVIREVHREAVDEVVRYYEDRAVFVRSGSGRRRLLEADGVVAAAFDHRTSRAGDPLLHTHVVTANMTCRRGADGELVWRAIPGAGLYEHARAAGHLYQAHLRHLLSARLGLAFTPVVNGTAEVLGVPERVVELFSKRRQEIAEVLSESGASSARAAQVATLETRQAKQYGVDADTLDTGWRREAAEVGFGPEQVAACFDRTAVGAPVARTEVDVAGLFDRLAGPSGLTERSATFRRTEVIEAIASAVGASASAREVEALADRFLGSERALLVDRPPVETSTDAAVGQAEAPPEDGPIVAAPAVKRSATQKLYTTPELAAMEAVLLRTATIHRRSVGLGGEVVEAALADRPELSAEQTAMVRAVCASAGFVMPVAGRPGSGKTYATEAVVAAHVAAGVPIIGCSVSATAAMELERQAGFRRSTGVAATTVAKVLHDLDRSRGGLRPGTVVVVDEASMLATRDLHRLAAAVWACGGAVTLIGDPDQHGSVDVGGVFRRLCADRGDGLVRLVDNNRQQDPEERRAVVDYRQGQVAEALARYERAGKVVRSPTAGESFDAIVADWYAARRAGCADPMIAGPNATRRALNERARALLGANGELTGPVLDVAGRQFQVGEVVVARRNDRTLRSDSGDFVKNGSAGTVTRIERSGDVVVDFELEGTVRVPHRYLAAGHLEHGYARTSYGVQGATHAVARYHPTDVSSFEEGYVALTRARQQAKIYLVHGELPEDAEFSHQQPASRPFGMQEVAAGLQRRRAGIMAADAAPDLDQLARLQHLPLHELSRQRRRLAARIDAGPPDVADIIADVTQQLDALLARRRASGSSPSATAPRLARLDRALDRAERRLAAAEQQQADRQDWIDRHAPLITQHRLLERAERTAEVRVRADAEHCVDPMLLAVIGPEPSLQRDRRSWRRAVEAVAVYRARYPELVAAPEHAASDVRAHRPGGLLGPRPSERTALADWLEARSAIEQATQAAATRSDAGIGL